MKERVGIAVAGCGFGLTHMKAYKGLTERFDLCAVCDVDQSKARKAAEELGIPAVITDFAELLRRDDVRVVDICTPPFLHFEQITQALAAGKDVICEKPLASSLKEVDAIAAAEKASGRRVMPVFQYRFGHGLQKVKFLVEQGLAGKAYLHTVETAWRRPPKYYETPWRGKWKTERGGIALNLAIHAHDMLCYIAGPIRSVFARAATRVNAIEVEDCLTASLEMGDGSLASLSATTGSCKQITRHRFCFSRFSAESNVAPYHNSCDPWEIKGDSPEIDAEIQEALTRFVPRPEWLEGQFVRFHEALTQGGDPPVVLADARAAVELVTALYHSAETGQSVEFPIGPDHPKYGDWTPERARGEQGDS